MNLLRLAKHLLLPHWVVTRAFPAHTLQTIEQAISASEKRHAGELRFVVEGDLPLQEIWRGRTTRQRAIELFSQLRVWDTEHNCGILIYVQWLDRAVEILADRGIAKKVPQEEWDAVCREMENAFGQGNYEAGAMAAVDRASALLATYFPPSSRDINELPDKPLLI